MSHAHAQAFYGISAHIANIIKMWPHEGLIDGCFDHDNPTHRAVMEGRGSAVQHDAAIMRAALQAAGRKY